MSMRVTIPPAGVYRIRLDTGQDSSSRVTIPQSNIYQLICDGLVSDKQLVNLTGRLDVLVDSVQADVDASFVLKPVHEDALYLATTQTDMEVVRNLATELMLQAGFSGNVTVEYALNGAEDCVDISTLPSTLSGSVYALVSEWTESLLSDLEDMSLDELIYKEV